MENKDCMSSTILCSPEELPPLFKYITSKAVTGFDTTPSPRMDHTSGKGAEATNVHNPAGVVNMLSPNSKMHANESHQSYSISISLPDSPSIFQLEQDKGILFDDKAEINGIDGQSNHRMDSNTVNSQPIKKAKFHSQPIGGGVSHVRLATEGSAIDSVYIRQLLSRNDKLMDKHFDSFKTWFGKLEWQILNLQGKPQVLEDVNGPQITGPEAVPALHRYFDALEGPELETLKASEELALPGDEKWPFLLRFPISSFGICLGISSQAILWKALATSPPTPTPTRFLHVSATINLALWCISLVLTGIVSLIYSLKIILYFEAVRREYFHPIRVNFFFAPWITFLFLSISVPPSIAVHLHHALWYVLMAPILCLELKLYGQWMSGGQRRLSKVANPSNHLSVVGNFVGALLGASMGLKEGPIFFFAVGLAHYIVLFVTLYQRLPTNETLPKELHPVFFLFVAAPSVACVAWEKITGDFGYGSRIAYFIALFLYISLAVRINFFRGFRFSLAWWAYTFPMTGASIATIRYATKVNNILTQSLFIALFTISTITVTALLVSTVIHAFVLRDLFPNDISIAITITKARSSKRHRRQGMSSSDTEDIEVCASAKAGLVLEAMLLDARLSQMIAKKPVFRT